MHIEDPAFSIPTGAPAPLDPQIAEFVKRMAADGAKYPRRDTISIAQAREIAEKVRAPWAQGGPVMAHTIEHHVPTRHGDVLVRAYYPKQRPMAGALFYIHGGGFVLFSINTHDRIIREYAERAGMVVIGIEYTRAPDAKFPQPLEECVDVFRWITENAQMLEIDAARIFIGGDSAGANLSMGTCITLRETDQALPRGVVLNYGGFGSSLFRDSVVRYGAGDYGLSLHMMIWFRGMHIRHGNDFLDPRVDILRANLCGLPPAFLVIAQCDPLHDDSMVLNERLLAAGVDVYAKVYPGTVHSFLEAVSIADVAKEALDDTARWLELHAAP